MLTQEQINEIRVKSGLAPKEKITNNVFELSGLKTKQNFVGKYDYLKKQTRAQETLEDIKQTGQALKETIKGTREKIGEIATAEVAGEQGKLRSFGQTLGTIAGGVSRGIGDVLTGAIKSILPQASEDAVKKGVENIITTSVPVLTEIDKKLGRPVGSTIDAYNRLPESSKRDIDALLGISELALDLSGAGLTKKAGQAGLKTTKELGETALKGAREGIETAVETTVKKGGELLEKAKTEVPKLITPEPKPLQAVGEVLQGKTKDIKQGLKSISAIDVKGVKTYKDLENKIKGKITELARKVDTDLAKDTTITKLKDLKLIKKTAQGAEVVIEPVKTAIRQLAELYDKIGDKVKGSEVIELLRKAQKEGLTNLEVNQLARQYGVEFGSKAFGKTGEALTSVNAKLFENTRKNLKEIARSGIKGTAAKKADELMSSLYDTQTLVQKNVEAVNKLSQKIRDRGLFEKVGYNLAKYSDLLTGGTIRGIVGGVLPRGVGYKTLNALDIEKALQKNLEIIQKAIKSKSDDEINNLLKKLNQSK